MNTNAQVKGNHSLEIVSRKNINVPYHDYYTRDVVKEQKKMFYRKKIISPSNPNANVKNAQLCFNK